MLSFFGKIVLLIAAAFGLGALAGRRGRRKTARHEPAPAGRTSPERPAGADPAAQSHPRPASKGATPPAPIRPIPDPSPADEPRPSVPLPENGSATADKPAAAGGRERGAPLDDDEGDTGGEALAASARLSAELHDSRPLPDDPLTEKYRAEPFRKNFRSVDYSKLSLGREAIEAARKRRRLHSSWHAPDPVRDSPALKPGARAVGPFLERFASFGGASVSADVIMGGDAGIVPDMTPTLPGEDPDSPTRPAMTGESARRPVPARPKPIRLGDPHPDLPTPGRRQRTAARPDPLLQKHRATPFDRDWRTLDYGQLRDAGSPGKPKSHDWTPKALAGRSRPKAPVLEDGAGAERPASFPAAFSALGVAAAVPGAPDHDARGPSGRGAPSGNGQAPVPRPSGDAVTPLGARGAQEGAMGLEPERLDAPRGDKPDDLTRIKGIGPTIERLLFEHGIYHFDQIAGWSSAEAQWIEQMIGFAGRVGREGWIAQARRFADDGAPKG